MVSVDRRRNELFFFFQAEAGIRDTSVTGVQTCALPIYGTTLLRGVTGSGKTEVYLEAVAEALRQGRQALEIGRASCRERV